ncbi:hypothetical protein BC831DRAFT_469283 [Entophlyctis helioformis]|nr:hypothetical protein BC831DRAFT_469283 [Entophlyctis helioformis]
MSKHRSVLNLKASIEATPDNGGSAIVSLVGTAAEKGVSGYESVLAIRENVEKVADAATKVVGDSNPVLLQTIEVAKRIFDVGQQLPFIAPIFAVLQIIVDIEVRAREADAKCADLLERINFMVEHLAALDPSSVQPATQKVVSKMESVLKESASVIQTYRKQNAIVRRLNTNNKERFVNCAESIEACSRDLLFSLQIQQTTQLNILTRAVKVDAEDQAAQEFLDKNGGFEAVKNNPELVREFAGVMKLEMDDTVMTQLNANLADLFSQNQAAMEAVFKENMSTAVADGLSQLARTLTQLEREVVLACVQCGKDYRESTNAEGSCAFHETIYKGYSGRMACCGSNDPCKRTKHRPDHHCEYKYGAFFERSTGVLNYTDTVDYWMDLTANDFESEDNNQSFSCGRLLRWTAYATEIKTPTLLVIIGFVNPSSIGYHFAPYTAADLARIQAGIVDHTESLVIYRVHSAPNAYTMGEWIVSEDGVICGIRMTAKTASLRDPDVLVARFDPVTLERVGETEIVSKSFVSYKPASPYVIPAPVRIGASVPSGPLRPTRTDFKTRTSSPDFPVLLVNASTPPLKVNTETFSDRGDRFFGTVNIFNKHSEHVTILSASAAYRLLGDALYTQVDDLVIKNVSFPATIDPRKSLEVSFVAFVPRAEADLSMDVRWWNRSVVARFRPLRLRLTVTDLDGNDASTALEYVFKPFWESEELKDSELGIVTFHDTDRQTVYRYAVTKIYDNSGIVVGSTSYNEAGFNKLVYHAMVSGTTEIDLGVERVFEGRCVLRAWALVDLNCKRVYAIKLMMLPHESVKQRSQAAVAYVAVPDYGTNTETREVQYAVEHAAIPADIVAPPAAGEPLLDDTVDDLTSIDNNLARTATALEGLCAILKTLALHEKDRKEP